MVFTQSSQLRLGQRSPDAGVWIIPTVRIEESHIATPGVWTDASDYFEIAGCVLAAMGRIVEFRVVAVRTADSGAEMYRLVFPEREDTITIPQIVGELAIVSTEGAEDPDRTWAIYPLVGTPEGRLETLQPFDRLWPPSMVGDVVQFYGTWFI